MKTEIKTTGVMIKCKSCGKLIQKKGTREYCIKCRNKIDKKRQLEYENSKRTFQN